MESKTITISQGNKGRHDRDGIVRYFKQVVIKTPVGKNRKGKQVYHSKTKHVPV